MSKYLVTLEIDTNNGNPAKWNWQELLDEYKTNVIHTEGIEE